MTARVGVLLLLFGLGFTRVDAAAISVVDDTGARITLPAPARRIIGLAPSATELVYAAGGGAGMIATVAATDWPPEARALPRVGDAFGVDLERIVAYKPDLLVTWPYTSRGQVDVLRGRGIAVFMADPGSASGIAHTLEKLGMLAGTESAAKAAAMRLRERYEALRERYRGRPPVSVFYEVWGSPLVTLGGDHIVTRAIEACGGHNVFAGLHAPAPNVSEEAVLATRPDAIIAGADGGRRPAWLDHWRRRPTIPAIAYGNLFVVNADLLHRAGPRFVDGVAELCEVLDEARARREAAPRAAVGGSRAAGGSGSGG